jgi:hypothetical protein
VIAEHASDLKRARRSRSTLKARRNGSLRQSLAVIKRYIRRKICGE